MDQLFGIRVFCTVVELGSFAAAAKRLNISPTLTSKHVMQLEKRLSTRLLNRTSRHLSLTEAGNAYFEHSRRMLEDLQAVEAVVSNATVIPQGVLKISAPVWLGTPGFVSVLADYQRQYPEVRLDVDLSGRMVNLVDEGFDLALRVSATLGHSLIARPIGPVRFHLVASPGYLAKAGRPLHAAQLPEHAMMSYSLSPIANGMTVNGPQGAETIKIVPILQSNSETLLHLAALQGMGLAFLPQVMIRNDLLEGRLEIVLAEYHLGNAQLCGVYQSRSYLSSKVRTFLDFVSADPRMTSDVPLTDPGHGFPQPHLRHSSPPIDRT
jgi:DNA-binding transcriptional LysR family regulator